MTKLPNVHARKVRARLVSIVALALAFAVTGAHADPGELFPNVKPYEETVTAPISRPDRAVKVIVTPPEPQPERPQKVKPPKKDPVAFPEKSATTAPAKNDVAPPKLEVDVSFHPFAFTLNQPLLGQADFALFEKEYAEAITRALGGRIEDRRKLSVELAAAAENARSDKLKRFLLLHSLGLSIRGGATLDDRTNRANAVLPLLTEPTLAVSQARADCLNDLMLSASLSPNDKMLDMYSDAFATLARMQVQAGFPKDAQDSLKKARDAFSKCKEKAPGRSEQIIESNAWVERANAAAALWPRWQQALKSNPDDPFANTQCALLHMALYGNPEQAQPFAARSDKKDLQKLAAALNGLDDSEEARLDPLKIYLVAAAIADVSRTVAGNTFDRYAIAILAGNKIDALIETGRLPAEKTNDARKQLDLLREQIAKTGIKPVDSAKWLRNGETPDVSAKNPDDAKKQAFSLGELFKECPKGTLPQTDEWTDRNAKAVNDWLAANFVGKRIVADAGASYFGQPVVRDDGSKYVPVTFTMPKHDIQGSVFAIEIESRMAPAVAARAGALRRGQVARIGGVVISARFIPTWSDTGLLRLVIGEKAD